MIDEPEIVKELREEEKRHIKTAIAQNSSKKQKTIDDVAKNEPVPDDGSPITTTRCDNKFCIEKEPEKILVTLNDSRDRYQALFNSPFHIIYLHDFEGKFIEANPAAFKLLGYDKGELSSITFSKLLGPDQSLKALQTIRNIIKDGFQKEPVGYRLKTKSGSFVDIETITEVVSCNGRPYAIQGIAHDITERKKAEEALKQANRNLTTILQKAPFGVTIIEKKRKIKWANNTACHLIGIEGFDALKDKHCREYFCYINQKECPVIDQGETLNNSECILRRIDGVEIPILKTVTEIIIDGEEVLLETFIEITEMKKMEALLKERLDELERFKKITVGRELKMVDLKKRIHDLEQTLNEKRGTHESS